MKLLDKKWLKDIKILYIEDEDEVRKATIESLESIFSNIVSASNGEEALELFNSHGDFDILVTDINMPKMNGIELSKKIREIDSSFPITIITAHTESEFLLDAMNLNINGYTLKPVNLKKLILSIVQAVEGRMLRKELEELNSTLINQLKEKTYELNSILNSQKTMVVVLCNNYIHTVNKQFLEFVESNSLDEFNKNVIQSQDNIEQASDYYIIDNYNKISSLTKINSTYKKDIIVKINNSIFKVHITYYDFNGKHYVLTFADITALSKRADLLKYQAHHDNLTKLFNRQKFNEILARELNRNTRYNHDFIVAMFDIDLFKTINDSYGHDVGDVVLINLSQTVKNALRETDTLARWGGEEFMILLPETTLKDGMKIIEKLRKLVFKSDLSNEFKESITCSFGVTKYQKNDTFDTILKRVDVALYKAKNNGRNRVEEHIL